jgi:tetratricopeptide (TPR) repeat protein
MSEATMWQKPPNTMLMLLAVAVLLVTAQSVATQGARQTSPKPSEQSPIAPLQREAQQAIKQGDWESAIRAYEKLVKAAPGMAESYLNLGTAYYSAGRPHDAVAVLRQALKLKPTLTHARYFLGAALGDGGQCQEALGYLKKDAPRITDPELRRAAHLAGVRCSMKLNQPDDAVDFIRRLNRDFPNDAEVLYLTVHVYSDLSIRASQDLLVRAPSSYHVRLLNAEALETQGRWDDAAAEYRQVLAVNPQLPGIHYRLGRLLLSAPEPPATVMDEARREFEEELKVDPNNAGAEYVLGELARRNHQWPEAIEHFSRAATLDPGFADAVIGLGRSLISARRFPEAVAPLEVAVKLQPEHPAAHYHLAIAYARVGRKEEAEKASAAFRELSEKARQARQEMQLGILGPQKAEP